MKIEALQEKCETLRTEVERAGSSITSKVYRYIVLCRCIIYCLLK